MTLRHTTLILLAIALALLTLRVWQQHRDDRPAARPSQLTTREWGGSRIAVPHAWHRVDARGDDHASWSNAARTHTVTLGSVAATSSLDTVTRGAAAALRHELAGARDVRVERDGDRAWIRFELRDDTHRLHVVQAWRRDDGAGLDRIATWTSADGTWPAPPAPPTAAATSSS